MAILTKTGNVNESCDHDARGVANVVTVSVAGKRDLHGRASSCSLAGKLIGNVNKLRDHYAGDQMVMCGYCCDTFCGGKKRFARARV